VRSLAHSKEILSKEIPMADKTYVNVATTTVKDVFDPKYKSSLPKTITESISKAIDRSAKFTTKPPSDKKAGGFFVTASVSLKNTGKQLQATISVPYTTWPGKSILGTVSEEADMDLDDPDKVSDDDVDAVIQAVLKDAQADLLKALEKQLK
jgi:hypothetical protein